jgi:ABC-2 type transport system permease protein
VIGLRVLLGKELREQVRTMRLPAVAVVFAALGLMSPMLAKYMPELLKSFAPEGMIITLPTPTAADAVAQFVKNLGQFGTLAAILLAMGAVAGEKERGTAALVLTKPASRGAFLLAKLVAIAITLGVGTAAGAATAFLYTAILFGMPQVGGFVALCLLLWLSLTVYAALTFLGSTLARSVLPAAGLGVAFLVVLGSIAVVPTIGELTPSGLSSIAAQVAMGRPFSEAALSIAANFVLIAGSFGVAWAVFRRQEL